MPPLQSILVVAAGSAVGGALRAILVSLTARHVTAGFPLGVLLVNVVGSFVFGIAMRMGLQGAMSDQTRLLITTGLCGGFTTFSAFSMDIVEGLEQGRTTMVTTYATLSIVLGVGAMLAGLALGRTLSR
ncbi:MAG: CrcB family protein [Gemmatimonadaceae bacterium]|nr:CrcB family protein [Gemmatimonadaceae bacterium]